MLTQYVNFAIDSLMTETGAVTYSTVSAFIRHYNIAGCDTLSMYFAYVIDRILDHF